MSGVEAVHNETNEAVENRVKELIVKSGNGDLADDVDKIHPVGQIKNKRQEVIIKFKSHSNRYKFFNRRKNLPKDYRIQPALTKYRERLLFKAQKLIEGIPCVDFVFADINGDTKVRLKEADGKGRYVFPFYSLEELAVIIGGVDFYPYKVETDSNDSDL